MTPHCPSKNYTLKCAVVEIGSDPSTWTFTPCGTLRVH